MNKKIMVFLIIIIVFGGLVWLAQPNKNNGQTVNSPFETSSASALSTPETFFNFGEISMRSGDVKHEFRVLNNTTSPIQIAKVYTSCMCTTAFISVGANKKGPFGMPGHGSMPKANLTIDAGAEATVEVIFDPAAHGPAGVGRIEREIYLEDESGAQTGLKFEATVTP